MCSLRHLIRFLCVITIISLSQTKDVNNFTNETKVLSRRKRFIIFPEGSSFQLVFCLAYPGISLREIVFWGITAALAYELPQDPYSPFNHKADPLHRRMDTKTIYFMDYDGKIIDQKPYKKKFIANPAFAKRSVDGLVSPEFKIDVKQIHASKHTREFLKGVHLDGVDFHRSSRARLYQQIEALLDGSGSDGRSCLLKTLCLIGQTENSPQGFFVEEILRAVFTLPKSNRIDDVDEEYDAAFSATQSCEQLYSNCNDNSNNLET
ncbi:unnamed protein product [Euphydryas editha]|uniref:Uncharacterized protein n=1 Tax=Euphydryas editha TaxID=104508 RepID=A0AAU9TKG9_EUPED|nr:unnamed protein product [Euphydryas editha]